MLLKVNGQTVTSLIKLEETLDSSVGQHVNITVSRGGSEYSYALNIGSTHDISPRSYVEVAGARFNMIAYHLARKLALPVKGVYVCNSPPHWVRLGLTFDTIIDSIDNKPVRDLDDLITVMKNIPDRARVVFEWRVRKVVLSTPCVNNYKAASNMHHSQTRILQVERRFWTNFRLATRNGASCDCTKSGNLTVYRHFWVLGLFRTPASPTA